jgi:magnesium chelatase family protein
MSNICQLPPELSNILEDALDKLGLSARAYHRILKVARTIADLNNKDHIEKSHLLEALSYRQLERRLQPS